MTIAAVTVHFGDSKLTENLIERLNSSDVIKSITVVLHATYSGSRPANVRWLEQPNRGYGAGLNAGIRQVIGTNPTVPLVLAMNPDVLIKPEQIEILYSEHTQSGASCTFPVLQEKNRLIYGYRLSRWGTLKISQQPDWYSGACLLFSVKIWKELGGFNESYFHYFEDRDFCIRARAAGVRLNQAKSVVVEHAGKSGVNYAAGELPKFAVRNHLIAAREEEILNPISFSNVITREFLYLLRWPQPWKGIPQWRKGIQEFLKM
jgi:GT2 family glycosyltransferase